MASNSKPEYMGSIIHSDDFLEVDRKSIDGLPASRKTQVFSLLGEPVSVDDGWYCFHIPDGNQDDEALRIMTAYYDNKRSRKRRIELELECEGIFLAEDIKAIYEIQEGRCYFSGEPISLEKKDYSADHLKPVRKGGSFWPGNLALVQRKINHDKHGQSKSQFWKMIEAEKGIAWVKQQKAWCTEVDKARRAIDRARRAAVRSQINEINLGLQQHFNLCEWQEPLSIEPGALCFEMDEIEVLFPPGMLRQKKKWANASYLISLVNALRG